MALAQRLELRQGQSLVMTPQLQQAIKLLQLSNLELAEYVETELERNPLLEREDTQPQPAESHSDGPAEASPSMDNTPLDKALAREDFGATSDIDAGGDDLYTDESRADKIPEGEVHAAPLTDWTRVGNGKSLDGLDDFEGTLSAEETLKGHLEAQLSIAALGASQRFIAVVLIESVDEAGYLRADLGEIAERLGATRDE